MIPWREISAWNTNQKFLVLWDLTDFNVWANNSNVMPRVAVPKLCAKRLRCAVLNVQDCLKVFQSLRERNSNTWHLLHTAQTWGRQCFNIRSYYIPLDYITSLQSWIFGGCCDQKQIPCKNKCGTENKGGGVQFDSRIWETVEGPMGTHIPLVSNYDYLRMR